jgi:hypothetical protein
MIAPATLKVIADRVLAANAAARSAAIMLLASNGSTHGGDAFGDVASFGTLDGAHTLAEVGELLTAKDYERDQIQAAADLNAKLIATKDPTWLADWKAYRDRYAKARFSVAFKVGAAGVGGKLIKAEDSWNEILATQKTNPQGPYTDKDPQGLFIRLQKIGVTPDVSKTPQPVEKDIDLELLKALPKVPDLPKAPVKAIPWWAWLLGGGGVLGVGYVAYRASPVGMLVHATRARR